MKKLRRWGVGLAGGAAVAAAAIGAAGLPAAYADDFASDIGLLNTAETDATDAFNALSQVVGQTPPNPATLADIISQYDATQTPLLSSDNILLSGLGSALFNGPDQQLAQSAETFLSAADTYVANPTSAIDGLDAVSASFQFDGSLLFDSLPANIIGKAIDDFSGLGTTSPSAATDLAASASALSSDVTGTPNDVLGQAVTDLSQGTSVLDAAPTADLSTDQINFFTNQESAITTLEPFLTQIGTQQDGFPIAEQAFVLNADDQLVTAAQNLLSADQALVAADQAGELTNSLNSLDFGVTSADFSLVSDYFGVIGADIIAPLFTDFGIPLP